jgi:transmembrane sensor
MSDEYESLILKSLDGTITMQEREALEHWMRLSPENTRQVESMKAIWKATPSRTITSDFDTSGEWQKLKHSLDQEGASQSVVKPIWSSVYFKVAAAVSLLLMSLFIFYLNSDTTIINGPGEITTIALPDGSNITMRGKSTLRYDDDFNTTQRLISFEGEAFFDITGNPAKPFVIKTEDAVVEVIGTSFNVRAIEGEATTAVYVVTGKVKVSNDKFKQAIALVPGETGVFSKREGSLLKIADENSNALSWKSKKLSFRKTSLYKVVESVEHYFDIQIGIENEKLRDCRFTSEFDNPTLEEVMEALTVSLDLTFTKNENGTYTLSGKGCL